MKVSRRVQVAAGIAALGLVSVAVGTRTSMWPARLGGPGDGGDADDAALDAANAAQIGELTDDPAEVPPDPVPGSPDADLLQRAEDARSVEGPETPKLAGGGDPQPQADPDTLLALFDEGTSADEMAAALDAAGVEGEPITGIGVAEVRLDGRDRDDVRAALEDAPGVTGVEGNLIRKATANPNDPQLANQLPALQAIRAPAAWDVADRTAKVTVAVLDTGVDLDHPDLRPNLVRGRDVINGDASPGDDNGHGTMTAGIIGAATGNGIGIAGVAWNARIMPVKVLNRNGEGTDAQVANGIIWATDHGADVINMSLGAPGASGILDLAVAYARIHDVLVVASSGNDGSTIIHYPAGAAGVLAVTATDAQGRFAWFSDHGPWISLAAPGIDVRTTTAAPGAVASVGSDTGTSFAAPLVAGVGALLRERHTGWSEARVAVELTRTARDAGPPGVDDAYGYGIVDAAAALGVAPKAPFAPPPDLTGDAGNFFSEAELVSDDLTAFETIGYEFDEDWFAFDVPAPSLVDIVVGSPPLLPLPDFRAWEFDPMFEVFAPDGTRVGPEVDVFVPGETEGTTLSLGAGRHTVRVRSWLGSAGPEPYQFFFDIRSTAAASGWAAAATIDGLAGRPVTGDLDADGDVDVATGNEAGDAIAVAWNEGGELSAPESYPADGTSSLVAVDLDGPSAHPAAELVGATDVWRWTGDGFTATPLGFDRGMPAAGGDVTGDGRADLVVAGATDGTVQVHAQQAGGTWAEPTDVAIAPLTGAASLAVGDVSGDGHADLVVAGTGADGATQVVRLLQSDGTLGEATALTGAAGAGEARAVAIGDVDGDDRADVAVLHEGEVGLYAQSADGRLGDEGLLPAPDAASEATLAVADLDADGEGDLVAAGSGADAIVVLERELSVATTPSSRAMMFSSTSPAPYATGVATSVAPSVTFPATPDAASVTTDNLFLVDGRTGTRVDGSVALSGDTITFTPAAPLAGGAPYRIVVRTVTLANLRNSASGDFPFVTAEGAAPSFEIDEEYTPLTLDLDGNGYDDILWYGPGSAPDLIWRMGPDGPTTVPVNVRGTYTPLTGDFDDNGFDDVFWYAPGSAADTLWYSGPAGFTARSVPVRGTYRPVVGDYNRNGYDDILWYAPGTAADTLWSFGSRGTTAASHPVNGPSNEPFAGDFDRDGFDDIVWYVPGQATVALWRGRNVPFVKTVVANIAGDRDPRPLDADGDGYDDVYWSAADDGELWRGGAGSFTTQDAPALPAGARPVAGELTGDLRDDVLGYVPGATADPLFPGTADGL